jgi:hypothetical protein
MKDPTRARPCCYYHEEKEGCALEAYPALLVDAWAARYQALKQQREAGANSREVYVVARSHEHYRAAAAEAYALHWMLQVDPSNASAYYYYRAYLADADYSEVQLQSVPRPQETICLHMMTNGVFTCVGKIHKASKARDERQWYYCTDCAWVYPGIPGEVRREDLRDEGIVLIPLDATYPVPFADPARAACWTRRVLLQQSSRQWIETPSSI